MVCFSPVSFGVQLTFRALMKGNARNASTALALELSSNGIFVSLSNGIMGLNGVHFRSAIIASDTQNWISRG